MKVRRSLTSATLRETGYDGEQDLSRMNDEGCPNDPLLNLPDKAGIESVCETLDRLTLKLDERLNLEDEGDLISSIIGYR
jgi:hypothetical protein